MYYTAATESNLTQPILSETEFTDLHKQDLHKQFIGGMGSYRVSDFGRESNASTIIYTSQKH